MALESSSCSPTWASPRVTVSVMVDRRQSERGSCVWLSAGGALMLGLANGIALH